MSFATKITCPRCRVDFPVEGIVNLCSCGSPLMVEYDFAKISTAVDKSALQRRDATLWRYREFLPLIDERNRVSLGEGFTALIDAPRLAADLDVTRLGIKDEAQNPTGSFKDRGMALAVSMAKELGIEKLAVPSAGNAGASLAAYAARAGIEAHVFMPKDAPRANITEAEQYGARLTLVDGLISDCGRIIAERKKSEDWFDVSTLKEPYRLEGKKTLGFEIAEQLGWDLPDVILYPTGGGTGLIGMWKGFAELEKIGWLGARRPRMVSVQAEHCAPIVRAFKEHKEKAEPWQNARTIAAGLRVPQAVADFLILRILRDSNGTAVTVSDEEMLAEIRRVGRLEGLFFCPEGAACVAALARLRREGWIAASDRVLLFNTASGLKYLDAVGPRTSPI
ncbi:MAG TPA: threonine synthase [Candidatus Binatia bacterium]|jgi:threonine synthase|nr:threonine synthase [Candidatus Binatia bacterium]